MKSFKDFKSDKIYLFHCSCGCFEFHRTIDMQDLTSFYEGHFICNACGSHHDYSSEAFSSMPVQTKLF